MLKTVGIDTEVFFRGYGYREKADLRTGYCMESKKKNVSNHAFFTEATKILKMF